MYLNPRAPDCHNHHRLDTSNKFTHAAYRGQLRRLLDQGYYPRSFIEGMASPQPRDLMIRQYIQFSPTLAFELFMQDRSVALQYGITLPKLVIISMDSESFDFEDLYTIRILQGMIDEGGNDISFGIQLSVSDQDRTDHIRERLQSEKKRFQKLLGVEPVAFALAGGVKHSYRLAHEEKISDMASLQHPLYAGGQNDSLDMWSDSNGGWYGSLEEKIDTLSLENDKAFLLQNSEAMWWSRDPLSPWERLKRLESPRSPESFPKQYVIDVQNGKRYIPGEPGSQKLLHDKGSDVHLTKIDRTISPD